MLERNSRIDAEALVLMTVHPRAVVAGLLGAEIARIGLWAGIPLVALVIAFALGLGAPTLVVTSALVAVPLCFWAAVWGYALGIGILRLLRRLPGVRRLLKASGVVVLIGFVVASQVLGRYLVVSSGSIAALSSWLTFAPTADYAALVFVGTPLARPLSARALAMLVGFLALTPVGLAIATHNAARLWFTDAPQTETQRPRSSSGWLTTPRPFAWWKTGRIAWATLVRTARHPQNLAHLVMAVFFLSPIGSAIVRSPGATLGPLVAGTGVGIGVYLSGATFGLNPLGDDRPQLPMLLLTSTPPKAFVRGRVLAGLAVGLPIGIIVPWLSVPLGTPLSAVVVFAGSALWMCSAAALFAVGLRAAYLRCAQVLEAEAVVPSSLVMLPYTFVVSGGTVIGLVVAWYALAGLLGASIVTVGAGVHLAFAAGVSYASYRYLLRRYRWYTLT